MAGKEVSFNREARAADISRRQRPGECCQGDLGTQGAQSHHREELRCAYGA